MRVFQGMLALALAAPAAADPAPAPTVEVGVYAGTFLSNYFHQFYDDAKWTAATRPNLYPVDPLIGARYAYWAWGTLGVEGEGSIAFAGVDGYPDVAKLYGLRVQAVYQVPLGPWAPFAALGAGVLHESSNALGSDTDWPIHAGAGVRYFITPVLAVRFDARFIRGPSSQPPYTLGASYGEFALGVSWVPADAP